MADWNRLFVDANVLVSKVVSAWMVAVCPAAQIELCTSDGVVDEAVRALADRYPNETREEHKANLSAQLLQYDVDGGPFVEAPAFTGRDLGDEHVYRAVIESGADALVTFNSPRDFSRNRASLQFAILSPDVVLTHLARDRPDDVGAALSQVAAILEVSPGAMPDRLKSARCPRFAKSIVNLT